MKAPPGYERIDLRFNSRKRRFVPDADEALFNPERMQVQFVHRHSPMCNCTSEGARSASPESITTTGSMDSGPAPRGASRNDKLNLKPRDDIRQRRARAVFARLRWRADVNEAREFFLRLQSQSIEHVAIEREPARQPARAIAERGRRGDDVHRTRARG